MTLNQAAAILHRPVLHTLDEISWARHVLSERPNDSPPRGFDTPSGCIWQRPAPGWIDLVRSTPMKH